MNSIEHGNTLKTTWPNGKQNCNHFMEHPYCISTKRTYFIVHNFHPFFCRAVPWNGHFIFPRNNHIVFQQNEHISLSIIFIRFFVGPFHGTAISYFHETPISYFHGTAISYFHGTDILFHETPMFNFT